MTDRRDLPPEWPASRTAGYAYGTWQPSHTVAPPVHPPARPRYADPYGSPQHSAPTGGTGPRHAPHPPARSRARTRRADANRWHWLLLVPIVLPLIPAIYNRVEPTLFGIPFFFWGQLAFAFLASAVIAVVHLMVR